MDSLAIMVFTCPTIVSTEGNWLILVRIIWKLLIIPVIVSGPMIGFSGKRETSNRDVIERLITLSPNPDNWSNFVISPVKVS